MEINDNGFKKIVTGLLSLILIFSILNTFLSYSSSDITLPKRTFDLIQKEEFRKVWWEENYEEIVRLSRNQVETMLWGIDDMPTQPAPTQDIKPLDNNINVDSDEYFKLVSDSYFKWAKNAEITWLEYSDIECPFCKKLHDSWVIDQVLAENDNVNFSFKHFPLQSHANAKPGAEILECVGSIEWEKAYFDTVDGIFEKWVSSSTFGIFAVIKDLNLNEESIKNCFNEWTFSDKVMSDMTFGNTTFGVTWTPWNVLLNNQTWEFIVIWWAAPKASFDVAISRLLSE